MKQLTCRSCGAGLEHTFIDLGETPLANAYPDPESGPADEKCYPLHARVCGTCFLVQVDDVVPPGEIFSEYAYFSSFSESWVQHARRYAGQAHDRLGLTAEDLVVEVASNDGYLLKHFVEMGIRVLGIEPAENVAREAEKVGVPTHVAFFGKDTASAVRKTNGAARLIAANNVLAHVPDINDFVHGFALLLSRDGVATLEFPHLVELIRGVQFDTIYHEHFSYLSLYAIEQCFSRNGLRIFDCERYSTHGGSLRIWCCHQDADYVNSAALQNLRQEEDAFGIQSLQTYEGFASKVMEIRDSFIGFLEQAKADGKSVAGFGAAAKGNTLLNYASVTDEDIAFVVDSNHHKQGHLLPGSRIPILSPDEIQSRNPDYVVIFPWNLKAEISAQLNRVPGWAGQCVTVVPELEIFR